MDPAILNVIEKHMLHHDMLGIVLWQKDAVLFNRLAPCFDEDQMRELGGHIHALFTGYQSMNREVFELSTLFDEKNLYVKMLNQTASPLYLAFIASKPEPLFVAVEEASLWTEDQLLGVGGPGANRRYRPARSSWNHFLLKLKTRLENSMGLEEGQQLLHQSLEVFNAGPTNPLPDNQWVAFCHHVTDQIKNPDELMRFNRLHSDVETLE